MSRLDTAENSAHTPWHLRDNWEPMQVEITSSDLRVEGTIPPELDGLYVRTGPTPRVEVHHIGSSATACCTECASETDVQSGIATNS